MTWVHDVNLLFLMIMVTTSSLAMYLPNGQQQSQPCASGNACLKATSRSYVNNVVLCCLNGAGLSVANLGNTVHCECGSGVMNFNGGSFLVDGQLLNEPGSNNRTGTQFQSMMTNLQQQMVTFRQQMAGLGTSLQTMFNGLNFW